MATSNPSRTPLYPTFQREPVPYNSSSSSMYPTLHTDQNLYNSSSSSMYPSIHVDDINNLIPSYEEKQSVSLSSSSETLVTVQGVILHLIDKECSVELACGDLSIVRIKQGDEVAAVFARVGDEVQWPLAKTEAAVKLDESHYFFSFPAPKEGGKGEGGEDEVLNFGLTIATKGQDGNSLRELDSVLEHYSSFTTQKVSEKVDGTVAREVSPADLKSEKKKQMMEDKCRAYWTTLAPNVEDYSGTAAKLIASGSGHVIKGILWCGDVTIDRLNWGNKVLRKSMKPGSSKSEISPDTLKRLKRVKRVTKMTNKVANGLLAGVVKVSGFFTSSIVNSAPGKKFFSLLPGEVLLASLDGFNKICDAVEVAGKNVMSTSSTVTTEVVSHRYGEEAGKATNEGMGAAGHAIGTAWAVFKLRKALNPKSVAKPTTLVKTAAKAASELKSKKSSK